MNNLIRSGIYTGVGSLVLAKQKLEELVEELIQNNELTQDEGQRIVQQAIIKAEDFRNETEHKLINLLDDTLMAMNLPGRNELEANISERISHWFERMNQFNIPSLFRKGETNNSGLTHQ